MGLRVPQNKIQEKKYTSGGEYIIEKTNESYKGYYYEFNNALYTGELFNTASLKLIPIQKRNGLLGRGKSLATFSVLSGITSQLLQSPLITSVINKGFSFDKIFRFFCKDKKTSIIREIDEDTYKSLSNNPLYETTSIQFDPSPGYPGGIPQDLDKAEKEISGISIFIGVPIEKEETIPEIQPVSSPIEAQLFEVKSLPPPLTLLGSVTDTPQPQDIIPVGPIFISNPYIPNINIPNIPVPSAPILSNLNITYRSNTSAYIQFDVDDTTNSTINRIGTNISTNAGKQYDNTSDIGSTTIGSYAQNRTGLDPQTYYYYYAYAMNNDGFTGSIGNPDAFWTLSNPPTVQASNLVAVTGSTTSVHLSWTPATFPSVGAYAKSYALLRTVAPAIPSLINENGQAPIPASNTVLQTEISYISSSYTASGLTTNTTYTFMLIPYTDGDAGRFNCYNYLTSNAAKVTISLVSAPTCNASTWTIGNLYTDESGNNIGYVYYIDTCNLYIVGRNRLYSEDLDTGNLNDPTWGCTDGTVLTAGGDISIGGGNNNTPRIINGLNDLGCFAPTTNTPYAAELCLINTIGGGNYTWLLPTVGDWNQIFTVRNTLISAGLVLERQHYWSSNEEDKDYAVTVSPFSGTAGKLPALKTNKRPVLPVTIISNPRAR